MPNETINMPRKIYIAFLFSIPTSSKIDVVGKNIADIIIKNTHDFGFLNKHNPTIIKVSIPNVPIIVTKENTLITK